MNPFFKDKTTQNYDLFLNLPVIRTIRNQESTALHSLFKQYLGPQDVVLEIGAGNGYYTFDIAKKVSSLIALEPAPGMVKVLEQKVESSGATNIKIVVEDFWAYDLDSKFDHVVAIGVLDYIEDWRQFLNKCLSLAHKSIIFTVPQRGIWSALYSFGARFDKAKIHTYSQKQLAEFFKGKQAEFIQAGLASGLTKGMTLVAAIKV